MRWSLIKYLLHLLIIYREENNIFSGSEKWPNLKKKVINIGHPGKTCIMYVFIFTLWKADQLLASNWIFANIL